MTSEQCHSWPISQLVDLGLPSVEDVLWTFGGDYLWHPLIDPIRERLWLRIGFESHNASVTRRGMLAAVMVSLLAFAACATRAGPPDGGGGALVPTASPSLPDIPGPLRPCDSQPAPGGDLLACSEARQMGAPWLRPDTDAQLDWYEYDDDSKPIVVWAFCEKPMDVASGIVGSDGGESPSMYILGDWGLVVDAYKGTFIVEGSNGFQPTPCPTE